MAGVLEVGLILSSVASAAASVASSQSANSTNRSIANQTNKTNLQLAREQNAYNERMWEMNNQYNSPKEQMQRLLQAGLSPAAAAQSVSGVAAEPVQSANLANQQLSNPMMPVDFSGLNMIGMARELAALKKDKAVASIAEQKAGMETPLLLSDLQAKQYSNKLAMQEFVYNAKSNPYKLSSLKYEASIKKYEKRAAVLTNSLREVQIKQAKQEFDFAGRMNEERIKEIQQRIQNLQKEEKKIEADTTRASAEAAQASAMVGQIQQTTENLATENEGQKSENRLKQLDVILKEAGAPESFIMRASALVRSGQVSYDTIANSLPVMRRYIHSGYKVLSTDPITQQFLFNVIDEGQAIHRSQGMHSVGAMRGMADDFINIFH